MTKEIALKIANEIADQFTNGFFNDRIADIIHKGIGVYDAAFNIRPVYAKYKEQPNEYLIHKYTMLLEELIANEGDELKNLKAFDFETYSRLKKEFG